jgi:elongation factor P hydroxylase
LDNRDLGTQDTLVIHVGTNDLKRSVNLDYVMGEVYSVVNKAKVKFPQSKIVLSGGTAANRCVMAAHWGVKRQIRLESEDIGSYICKSKQWA